MKILIYRWIDDRLNGWMGWEDDLMDGFLCGWEKRWGTPLSRHHCNRTRRWGLCKHWECTLHVNWVDVVYLYCLLRWLEDYLPPISPPVPQQSEGSLRVTLPLTSFLITTLARIKRRPTNRHYNKSSTYWWWGGWWEVGDWLSWARVGGVFHIIGGGRKGGSLSANSQFPWFIENRFGRTAIMRFKERKYERA